MSIHKKTPKPSLIRFTFSTLTGSREDADREFREMVKALGCPSCQAKFTDHAVDWGDAWCEGRWDLLRESGKSERDGPFKLKCESCGRKSWFNVFKSSVASAEVVPS